MKTLFFIIPVLFIGCASTAVTTIIKEPKTKLQQFEYININIEIDTEKLDDDIDDATIDLLKDTVLRKIFQKRLSTRILYNPNDDSLNVLRINMVITDIEKVSILDRLMIGAFAGQAKIGIIVECYDVDNSINICEAVITGRSSGGSAFAGTTYQAIEQASDQIAILIAKYF